MNLSSPLDSTILLHHCKEFDDQKGKQKFKINVSDLCVDFGDQEKIESLQVFMLFNRLRKYFEKFQES
jgi:hypothetical protein